MKKNGTTKYYNTALNINSKKLNKLTKLSTHVNGFLSILMHLTMLHPRGERVDLKGGT
jgi:hypothetical protein